MSTTPIDESTDAVPGASLPDAIATDTYAAEERRGTKVPARSSGRMTGAEAVIRSLEAEGVEICWGIPGGAILPLYDAWSHVEHGIRHVLVRHEQAAGHMAQGYARATGRVGVCMATSDRAPRTS
jgi:acetolactate synthase-1/2/3 large subunit